MSEIMIDVQDPLLDYSILHTCTYTYTDTNGNSTTCAGVDIPELAYISIGIFSLTLLLGIVIGVPSGYSRRNHHLGTDSSIPSIDDNRRSVTVEDGDMIDVNDNS